MRKVRRFYSPGKVKRCRYSSTWKRRGMKSAPAVAVWERPDGRGAGGCWSDFFSGSVPLVLSERVA